MVLPGIHSLRIRYPRMRRAVNDLARATTSALRENSWERIQLLLHPAEGRHPAVRAALAHLRAHLAQRHGLDSLASAVGCSRSRLAEVFAAEIGLPPLAWLERERMERAKRLLLTSDMGIADIAEQVGYGNAFHFTTRFRVATGLPPSAWRRAPQ